MNLNFRVTTLLTATLALLMMAVPLQAGPSTLPQKSPAVPGSFADVSGVYVIDLATGEVITDINGARPFIPASVTKAVTTASVLCLKDSAERFVTPVAALGKIKNGVLEGNIVVSCTGDPTIESRHMGGVRGFADSIAAGVKALGINRVKGRIIIDEAEMGPCDIPSGWMDEDLTEKYGAELFGANYGDNITVLSLPACTTSPATPGLEIEKAPGKRLSLKRDRHSRKLKLTGTAGKSRSMTIANPLPCSTMEAAVKSKLADAGIAVEGADVKPSNHTELIYTHVSPRYVDIMRSLMVRSDNLYAEGMLRTLAPGEKRQEAIAEELDIWTDNEVNLHGVILEDGSGLSRSSRLTPRFLAEVLEWMAESLVAPSYVRLFPTVGREGTVRNFLKGTPLEGRMVLKTGSMRGVQSYAGYKLDEYGTPTHAVVVMCNNFKCDRGKLRATIKDVLMEIFAPEANPEEGNTSDSEDELITD